MPSYDRTIPPGGRGKITLETNTTDFSGRIRKDATVFTNDPSRKELVLVVEANIKSMFEAKPWNRLVISTPLGKPGSQTITLTNQLETPLVITGLTHDLGDAARVELETVEAGQIYMLTLSTRSDRAGRKAGRIVLTLKDGPSKHYHVLAYVHVWAPKQRSKPGKGKSQ